MTLLYFVFPEAEPEHEATDHEETLISNDLDPSQSETLVAAPVQLEESPQFELAPALYNAAADDTAGSDMYLYDYDTMTSEESSDVTTQSGTTTTTTTTTSQATTDTTTTSSATTPQSDASADVDDLISNEESFMHSLPPALYEYPEAFDPDFHFVNVTGA